MSGSTYDNFSNAQAARLDALKETSKMVAGMKGNGALAPLAQNGLNSLQVTSVIELAQFVIGESESVNSRSKKSPRTHSEKALDIAEEPPVGSFVVDHGADNVWERKDSGWFNHSTAENRTYPWAAVNAPDYRPLRPTTDADRERVGLLTEPSVNVTETPDLSTEDAGESSEPAPADVDPDEGPGSVVDVTDLYAQLDKAEADLARVTKERYKWEGRFVALRHDVWVESGSRVAAVAAAAHGILARDDERAES